MFLGEGWLVYAGPFGQTELHAHHAFQLLWTLDGTVSLRGGELDTRSGVAAALAPDTPHAIEVGAAAAVVVWEDPDTLHGRRLRRALAASPHAADWIAAGAAFEPLRGRSLPAAWETAHAIRDEAFRCLVADATRPSPLHPALIRTRAWLASHLDDADLSLDRLGAIAGVSGDRLSHLLNDELGLGLRPLVLWLRMQRAARELAAGRTLTAAAATAGFADGPHLTRTFRRMFGLAPSELVGFVEWVLPPDGTS